MTRKEVAELLGVDVRVVTRYAARGWFTKYVTPNDGMGRPGTVVFSAKQAHQVARVREHEREAERARVAAGQKPRTPRW